MDSNTVSSLRTSPAMNKKKTNQIKSKQNKNKPKNHTKYTHTKGSKRKQNKHKAEVNFPEMFTDGTDVITKLLSCL